MSTLALCPPGDGGRVACGHRSGTFIPLGPRLRAPREHPPARSPPHPPPPTPPGRSDPRGPLCVRLSGSSVPFSGEPAEFGSSRRALPPPFPGSKQRRTCQAPLGSQEGLASRCSGHFWRRSRIAQVRYGSSLNAAADFCVSPGSLPPQPRQRDASTAGAGGWECGGKERENARV